MRVWTGWMLLILAGCALSSPPEAPLAPIAHTLPTTRAEVAESGLDVRIAALEDRLPGARDALIDALGLRLALFGRVEDLDRMHEVAGDTEARAAALMAVHRFDDALAVDPGLADSVALARHEDLERLEAERRAAVDARASTRTWTALGDVLLAEGDAAGADTAYWEALHAYRDVSPLTVAELQFRRGLAWGESGEDPERARALYGDAVAHLPGFVRAQVHLAELEWEAGDHEAAVARVRGVADAEDPEPGGKLAVWLEGPEADVWERRTTAAYDALLAEHPLAFANHGAEYFLAVGDLDRARELASWDLTNRPTERARDLCARTGCSVVE